MRCLSRWFQRKHEGFNMMDMLDEGYCVNAYVWCCVTIVHLIEWELSINWARIKGNQPLVGRSLFQCGLNQAREWVRLSVGTGEEGMVSVCTQWTEMKRRRRKRRRSRRNDEVRPRGNCTAAQAWCSAALAVDCEAWARRAVNMKTRRSRHG